MSNSQWHEDQAAGEAAMRRLQQERDEMPQKIRDLQELVSTMWVDANDWHGPTASSHYRSHIREKAEALGVKLP